MYSVPYNEYTSGIYRALKMKARTDREMKISLETKPKLKSIDFPILQCLVWH